MSLSRFVVPLVLATLAACGGGGTPPPQTPSPSPSPGPAPVQNPCVAALAQDEALAVPDRIETDAAKRGGLGADERDAGEALWLHALGAAARPSAGGARPYVTADIGNIAVLEDDGTLLLPQNAFDLRSVGVRFERNGSGGYDAVSTDAQFRSPLGRRLTLQDDDTVQEALPFSFSFYGQPHGAVFVNSDGNLTFEQGDAASSTRGFVRLLNGPPRVSPFFADLDPTTGGRVFLAAGADAFTVTWCSVRGFDSTRTMTVQTTLFPSGLVEVRFGAEIDLAEGIVAISPGRTGVFAPVDLAAAGRRSGGSGAIGERFAEQPELDLVSVARRFYQTHPDTFDQLILWTDARVVTDAFAFETTIANSIRGLGLDVFDASRDFGSGGSLSSLVVMDRIGKYPDDPTLRILGESSTLAVVAHETAHRWLVRLLFRDERGQPSDFLLGRQRAHWSFFMDSDASVMEGHDIEDLRGGSFRTTAAALRYSRLDLYAMGLATPAEVPPFFYVDAPINVVPSRDRESAPRVGTTFNGTRRDVLIQDVVDALGPRQPSSAESPRLHRQAFVFVVSRGVTPLAGDLARLERIRREWEAYFRQATENRMQIRTTLSQ